MNEDLRVRLGLQTGEFDAKLAATQKRTRAMGATFGSAMSLFNIHPVLQRLGSFAAHIFTLHGAVFAIAGAFGLWYRRKREAEKALGDAAEAAGLTTKALRDLAVETGRADLVKFAEDLKIVSDTLGGAMRDGASDAAAAWKELGLEMRGAFRTTDEDLRLILERVKELGRAPETIAAAARATGLSDGQIRSMTAPGTGDTPMSAWDHMKAQGARDHARWAGSHSTSTGSVDQDPETAQKRIAALEKSIADRAKANADAKKAQREESQQDAEARFRLLQIERQIDLTQQDSLGRIALLKRDIEVTDQKTVDAADDATKRTAENADAVERLMKLRSDLAQAEKRHAEEMDRLEKQRTAEIERQTREREAQAKQAASLAIQEAALRGQIQDRGRLSLGQLASAEGVPSTRFGRQAVMAARQAQWLEQNAPWMRAEGRHDMADAAEGRARNIRGMLEQAGVIQADPAKALEDRLTEVREHLAKIREEGVMIQETEVE